MARAAHRGTVMSALAALLLPGAAMAQELNWQVAPSAASQAGESLTWQVLSPPPPVPPGPSWQVVDSQTAATSETPSADSLAWEPVSPGQEIQVSAADAPPASTEPDDGPTTPARKPEIPTATEKDPTAGGMRIAAPYLGGGVPSAYTLTNGDFFIAGTAGTQGKLRDNVDGSFNLGFGLGNPYNLVSLEVDVNFGSTKNFATNGGLDASISRVLVTQPRFELAVGGGYLSFFSYGTEGVDTPNGYGVVTMSTVLNYGNEDFPQILQFSAGVGGNTFSYLDPVTFTGPDIGVFGSVGVELTPQFGVSVGWSGRGGNASVSYIPFPRELPLSINLMASDIANTSPYGTVALLTIAWGGNFMRDFGYHYGQ